MMWPQVKGYLEPPEAGGAGRTLPRASGGHATPTSPWPLDLGEDTSAVASVWHVHWLPRPQDPAPHLSRPPGRALTYAISTRQHHCACHLPSGIPPPSGEAAQRWACTTLVRQPQCQAKGQGESPMVWGCLPCPSPPGFQAGALSRVPRPAEQTAVPRQPLHLSGYSGAQPRSPPWTQIQVCSSQRPG